MRKTIALALALTLALTLAACSDNGSRDNSTAPPSGESTARATPPSTTPSPELNDNDGVVPEFNPPPAPVFPDLDDYDSYDEWSSAYDEVYNAWSDAYDAAYAAWSDAFDAWWGNDDLSDTPVSTASPSPSSEPSPSPSPSSSSSNSDWKQFLKEYEEWVDSYIALLKKYNDNPLDLTILTDYLESLTKLVEWSEKADEIEDDLTGDDLKEYLEVMTRIIMKLSSI